MSDSHVNRRSARLRVTYYAKYRSEREGDRDVKIVNVSADGCCIELGAALPQIGASILLRLESGEALTGTVRWVRGDRAGVLFDEYLERPRMEYLRREHSTFLSEADWDTINQQRAIL